MDKERLLTYAYNRENKLIHIDDVENGNNCGCRCPHCNEPLCAKNNGKIQAHHFSHQSGTDCEGAYETAVHLLAKEILVENKRLQVFYEDGEIETLVLEEVIPEYHDKETGLTPDVFAKSNGNILWIEFKNTHPVDENKIKKIKENAIDCIEIDISGQELDKSKLNDFLSNKLEDREWIYSKENNEIRKKREQKSLRETQENITTLIKEMIKNKNLWLSIPVEQVSCKKRKECRIGNENCDNQKRITFNLCEHKYDKCTEKEYTDEKGSTKLCLTLSRSQEKDQKDNINIILSSDGNNEKTEGKETTRTIKPKRQEIKNIEYILQNDEILYITDINDIIGFKIKEVPPQFLNITVRKLVADKNGYLFLEEETFPCHDKEVKGNALFTLFINDIYEHNEDYRRLALLYCYKKRYKLRYCELCCYSFRDNGYSLRCKRYITKGTPHFPLKEKDANRVIHCPWIRLDNTLNIKEENFKFIRELHNQ